MHYCRCISAFISWIIVLFDTHEGHYQHFLHCPHQWIVEQLNFFSLNIFQLNYKYQLYLTLLLIQCSCEIKISRIHRIFWILYFTSQKLCFWRYFYHKNYTYSWNREILNLTWQVFLGQIPLYILTVPADIYNCGVCEIFLSFPKRVSNPGKNKFILQIHRQFVGALII